MKAYQVQFSLPCEHPEDNIRRTLKKTVVVFEVPINTPDIQDLGYSFLMHRALYNEQVAEQDEKLSTESPTLNKKSLAKVKKTSIKDCEQQEPS